MTCMYVSYFDYRWISSRWKTKRMTINSFAAHCPDVLCSLGTNKVDETSPEMRCKSDDKFAKVYTEKSSFIHNYLVR